MFALILLIICIIGASIGQIAMKQGMNQVGEIGSVRQLFNYRTLLEVFTNKYIFSGLLCYGVITILWLGAMSTLNISFMYPLLSLAYIVTAIVAVIFLKESVTIYQWAGIVLVVGGCILIIRT